MLTVFDFFLIVLLLSLYGLMSSFFVKCINRIITKYEYFYFLAMCPEQTSYVLKQAQSYQLYWMDKDSFWQTYFPKRLKIFQRELPVLEKDPLKQYIKTWDAMIHDDYLRYTRKLFFKIFIIIYLLSVLFVIFFDKTSSDYQYMSQNFISFDFQFFYFWDEFSTLLNTLAYFRDAVVLYSRQLQGLDMDVVLLKDSVISENIMKNMLIVNHKYVAFWGIDGVSLWLIVLTTFIFPLCMLMVWENYSFLRVSFFLLLLVLEIFILFAFTTLDLFLFYVFFEFLLIPMILIIGIWGARTRKIHAIYYFFFFTFIGSLLMLFGILYIFLETGTTNYLILFTYKFDSDMQKILWILFFFGFAVKIPMFPFHSWLPEAHVEAPTVGSVILAAVLLKLGGYGFIRVLISFFPIASQFYHSFVYTLSIIGLAYASLIILRQTDLKKIIAYSSIAHMNFIVLGIFSEQPDGIVGAILLMLSHGVVSAGLFFSVGVLYDRYHNRTLAYYGGLTVVMPKFVICFFLLNLANIGFPLTSSFPGEMLIFFGVIQKSYFAIIFTSISVIASAAYTMWMVNRMCFGELKLQFAQIYYDLVKREAFIYFVLFYVIIMLGLFPQIFILHTEKSVELIHQKYVLFNSIVNQ